MDPIHFAAVLGVNLGMANITPPTAPLLYLGARVTGAPVNRMMKPVLIMIVFAWLPTLIVTTFVPSVALWLPGTAVRLGDRQRGACAPGCFKRRTRARRPGTLLRRFLASARFVGFEIVVGAVHGEHALDQRIIHVAAARDRAVARHVHHVRPR